MRILSAFIFLFLLSPSIVSAQPDATSPTTMNSSRAEKSRLMETSRVKNLPLTNIGPSIMSGRVVDLDVNPEKPSEFYVAYASGGLWYTSNNGTSFVPVMDNAPTQNIGDIAVHWPTGTLWVGTGENNASRSSYAGLGLLKSSDKGKSWQHMGLDDSHHISRILINPDNENEVVVAVLGHLYSPNIQRGIFRTTDGGNSWSKTLYINENTGMVDLEAVPGNFNELYATSWERDRKAWDFVGNGKGSGIYKSLDGGQSWFLVSNPESGFPTGAGVGRIGLAVADRMTVYAFLDNQYRREGDDTQPEDGLRKDDFKKMSSSKFLEIEDKALETFLRTNNFQSSYTAKTVKNMVRDGRVKPEDLARYLENANSLLFDTPVIGAEVYRSDDGGKTWAKTHESFIEDVYYSYGYYFGQIRVAPYNKNEIYITGVPILRSTDGGATFKNINGANVHSDHHALWINPKLTGHIINGNDGGVNISYDYGENWIKNNNPSVGQFYAINVDYQEPYNVYGGLQDNGVWMGPHNHQESTRWHSSGEYPWKAILGGDGMQVQIDRNNPNTVITGFQFGNYFRIDVEKGSRKYIQPKHSLGEAPYRFNWQTPVLLSPHNQDILYLGSNKLHRSMDQGDHWEPISGDLTLGGKKGSVPYGTLTTLSESHLQFGLLYTGSDDGLIHLSMDGGHQWKRISDKLPQQLWISRVLASRHKKGRVYTSLNGYRWDDFSTYIYVSEDYGNSWNSISANLPASPVNIILEDPVNENLLFAGTDDGLYVSMDRGQRWDVFQNGMPHVAVHDLVIQEKANDLLVGTHGRSIYRVNIGVLQATSKKDLDAPLKVYDLPEIRHSRRWGNSFSSWSEANTPGLDIPVYSREGGLISIAVQTMDGIVLSENSSEVDGGFNILSYDVAFDPKRKNDYLKKYKTPLEVAGNGKTYLPKGTYEVLVSQGKTTVKKPFTIK